MTESNGVGQGEQRAQSEAARLAYIEDRMAVVSTLSTMQRRFVVRYLLHGNASRAADEAGYKYPDKQGSRLRQNDKIQNAIDEYFYAQEMSAAEVVARLSEQAKAAYGRYLYYDEAKKEVYCDLRALLAAGLGHLIKKVGYDRTGTDSAVQVVEFYDAHQALVDVARIHGLFKERTELSGQMAQVGIFIPDNQRGDNGN